MRIVSNSTVRLAFLLALSVYGCSRNEGIAPNENDTSFDHSSVAADSLNGKAWLRWDRTARLAFIMGNLHGYWDGQQEGCGDAEKVAEKLPGLVGLTPQLSSEMNFRCGQELKFPNRSIESYAETITEFYKSYPRYQQVRLQDVILVLDHDPSGRYTAEDVHRAIRIYNSPPTP
jgi:hypothetical protein